MGPKSKAPSATTSLTGHLMAQVDTIKIKVTLLQEAPQVAGALCSAKEVWALEATPE